MLVKLKIVPKKSPNADGRWIEVSERAPHSIGAGWIALEKAYRSAIPEDHFLVQVRITRGFLNDQTN